MTALALHTPSAHPVTSRPDRGSGLSAFEDALQWRAARLSVAFAAEYGIEPSVVMASPATVTLVGAPGWVDAGERLVVPVDRYALVALRAPEGRRVEVATDLGFPRGAGLGSRVAERCAVRSALRALGRPSRVSESAAETAVRSAVPGAALRMDVASGDVHTVRLAPWGSGTSLLVLDTGQRHLGIDGALAGRRRGLRRAAAIGAGSLDDDPVAFRCALHLSGERTRVAAAERALLSGDTARLGKLMTASHASLRDHLRVTSGQVDTAVVTALGAGALGARMIGAGFGGSVLALVPRGCERDVVTAVATAASDAGFPRPRPLPLTVAGGVARLR
jgi:galactokinase